MSPITLNNTIMFLVNRYYSDKDLFSNNLKLIKDDQNMGIFLTLNGDNQKT